MGVCVAVPTYGGLKCRAMIDTLEAFIKELERRGNFGGFAKLQGSCYIQTARNELVAGFLKSDSDVMLFWDDDISVPDVGKLADMCERSEPILAVAYRYKYGHEDYPVVINCDDDGKPILGEQGLISAACAPTGLMRIQRRVLQKLWDSYPSLKYYKKENGKVDEMRDLFPQGVQNEAWVGEDYAFCRLWTAMGGNIYVVPDMDIVHWSEKDGVPCGYEGNYHRYLLRQPGGSEGPQWNLQKAGEIGGWASLQEGCYLAEQASRHKVIVEIGSFYGRTTRCMADNTMGKVYAVDNWGGPLGEYDKTETEAKFDENCGDLVASGKVVKVTADHKDFGALDRIPTPDMVFVDGDHTEAGAASDIAYWKNRMVNGGLLCGHDSDWQGVGAALKTLLPEHKHVHGTVIWYQELERQSVACAG